MIANQGRALGTRWFASLLVPGIVAFGAATARAQTATNATSRPASTRPAATVPARAAATKPKRPEFPIGQRLEFKWGGVWAKGTVANKRTNGWYLLTYENGQKEWVEWWRLRPLGSKEDTLGNVPPNKTFTRVIGDPPRPDPGEPPGSEPKVVEVGQPPAKPAAPAGAAAGGPPAPAAIVPPITPFHYGGTPISFWNRDADGGTFTPDPEPTLPKPTSNQSILLTGPSGDPSEIVEGLSFATGGLAPLAVFGYGNKLGRAPTTRVERLDLAAGRSLGFCNLPVKLQVDGVTTDGSRIVGHVPAFGGGGGDRLDVWSLADPAKPAHVVSFTPYEHQQGPWRGIIWSHFVGPDHVLTVNFCASSELILWDLNGKAAVWHTEVNSTPAVSPGGKYVAASLFGHVAILDAQTGKYLRRMQGDSVAGAILSFSPDGKRVAATAPWLLQVWEVDTGRLLHNLSPDGTWGQGIAWVADDYILLDGRFLVDLRTGMVLWRYDRHGLDDAASLAVLGGRTFYIASTPGGKNAKAQAFFASTVLPDAKANEVIAGGTGGATIVLKPGSKVSLELNVPESIQAKALETLKAKLAANGVTVVDNEPLRFVATSEQGKSREMSYKTIGPRFGQPAEKVTVNEVIYKLQLLDQNGAILWQQHATQSPPTSLDIKKDQSVGDAVNEAMQPSAGFFASIGIPRLVPKGSNLPGLGATLLPPQGLAAGK